MRIPPLAIKDATCWQWRAQVLCVLDEVSGSTQWVLLMLEPRLFVNFTINCVYLATNRNNGLCCN